MSKARLAQLERRARAHVESRPGVPVGEKFMEAHSRGAVLCKDGQARPVSDWLKTLDPAVAAQIKELKMSYVG